MQPTRSRLPAQRRTIDRRIVGTPEQVRNAIGLATASGRLVHVSPWQETREGVQVTVRLIDRPEPAATTRPRVRRRWRVAAVATGGLTAAGVGAYALVQLVNAVIALLPVLAGGLLLLGLVSLLTGGRASKVACVTFHGAGCRHH